MKREFSLAAVAALSAPHFAGARTACTPIAGPVCAFTPEHKTETFSSVCAAAVAYAVTLHPDVAPRLERTAHTSRLQSAFFVTDGGIDDRQLTCFWHDLRSANRAESEG